MSACLSLESPLVVSYPGPEATFSHLAGKTRFGLSALYRPAASLGEVFREVGRGADYGVVPVEEASEGLVTHALDHFIDSDLLIVGEIVIEAAHALLTHTGATAGVERVFAHPVAAARCAAGLVEAVGGAAIVAAPSAAAAAAMARDDLHAAPRWRRRWPPSCSTWPWRSRASTTAPSMSRASWCSGGEPPRPTGDDATSLLIGLDDKPGRLGEVLNRLGGRGPQPAAHRLAPDRPARAARSVLPGSRRAPGRSGCRAALDAARRPGCRC